jgi:hypothetical protein
MLGFLTGRLGGGDMNMQDMIDANTRLTTETRAAPTPTPASLANARARTSWSTAATKANPK